MTNGWTPKETTTHQDHVIAHVLGATVLGHFVFDEALYVLLDIGFVWTIYLDGEMTLLPHPVAINELEVAETPREQIKADIDLLLSDNPSTKKLLLIRPPEVNCEIKDVNFFESGDRRRLILACEGANLAIEMSLKTTEITVYEC
jgi:hypothetical protein